MVLNHSAKVMFGYDPQQSKQNLVDLYASGFESVISIPLKIPGTAHYKCLKNKEKAVKLIRNELEKRQASFLAKEPSKGDLLDHAVRELNDSPYSRSLTEDFIVNFIFALSFVSHETIAGIMTLAVKLIEDHPLVLQELLAEHETILKARKSKGDCVGITWDEYKSMTFTLQVINETLRLGNLGPGILRRAVQDIHINGYTIPAGCRILIATGAMHLNPETYKDPLAFNPWRWTGVSSSDGMYKDLMPFGWGMKQCAGSEYARLFFVTFLHVLVTNFYTFSSPTTHGRGSREVNCVGPHF